MATDLWSSKGLSRRRFAAAAFAVAMTMKQQEPMLPTKSPIEDDEDPSDDDSIHPRDLVASGGEVKLQQKSLNRVAEILARQKTVPGSRARGSSTDADHVSAAMLGFDKGVPCVYVAKNAGLDDEDETLLKRLETWLRAVSSTGQRRVIENDKFWLSLIEYNRVRIEFYVSQLADIGGVGVHAPVRTLRKKCKNYAQGSTRTSSRLADLVIQAFLLRYKSLAGVPARVARLIGFLSRLRATWETLQEFALHYPSCRHLKIQGVEASTPVDISFDSIEGELETLQPGLSNKIQSRSDKRHAKHLVLHTHAEIQLLLYFGRLRDGTDTTQFVRYMGSSKKACWLCEQTLRRQAGFSSRGSHGEVSAHWTIEANAPLEMNFERMLIEGLCVIQSWLENRVCQVPGPRRQDVPQSTPAVTSSESAISIAKIGHRRVVFSKELSTDDSGTRRDETPRVYGARMDRISAICLPAEGPTSIVVDLDVCENLAGAASMGATSTIADFRPYWGDVLHMEQDHQLYDVRNQENKAIEGQYMVFFNTSEELPRNRCIATMLHMTDGTGTTDSRLFWKGDVFFVRWDETAREGGAFLPLAVGHNLREVIVRYLQHAWHNQSLERLYQTRQQMHGLSETYDRNRELLRARLTPLQIEILTYLSPGLEANLEFLAITEGDYGVIRDTRIEPCHDDPSLVTISYMRRVDELEKIGWDGFSAEQL